MKKLVYVAGPYTKGNVFQNVKRAIKAAEKLYLLGFIPFVPHLSHFWHKIFHHRWEFWMELDFVYLSRCDYIFRLSGESKGADMEMEFAKSHGIPELKIDIGI